jgi:hypothetical protein
MPALARHFRAVLIAGVSAAAWTLSAFAQAVTPGAEPGTAQENCQAAPAPPGRTGNAQPQAPGDLTTTLDNCNGVLRPPPTGDAEIREPAPNTGETPVVPPSALPDQQPPADGSAPAQQPDASGDTPA